jgi:TRAP-type transport system periplasmic protein
MRRWGFLITIAMVVLTVGIGVSYAQDKKFQANWKVQFNPMYHQANWQGKLVEGWAKEIEERTQGAVKMKLYWPGQLPYTPPDALKIVKDRLVDLAECSTSINGATEPLMDMGYQYFSFNDLDEYKKANLQVVQKHLAPIFDKKYNCLQLTKTASGDFHQWFSKTPVTKMEQMKGMKTRAYSKSNADTLASWGCSPITINVTELYTALQRGVVEAAATSFATGTDARFYEVLKYATIINFVPAGYNTILINKNAWEELPANYKAIIQEITDRYNEEHWRQVPIQEEVLRAKFRDNGVKILNPEPGEREKLGQASKHLWKEWLTRTGDSGVAMLNDIEKVLGRPFAPLH